MAKTYLEPNEVAQMENAVRYLRDRLLIRILFWVGCRVSEAIDLRPKDIDFAREVINIQHLKSRIRLLCPHCNTGLSRKAKFCPGCGLEVGAPIRKDQGTHRRRELPVDKTTLALLEEFIRRGKIVRADSIFKIGRSQAWRIVTEAARSAGLPTLFNAETGRIHHVSPHRLRDAFAVMAVQEDNTTDGIRQLQEHLGHASINTTMKYRKLSGEEQKEWYDKIAAKMKGENDDE